MYYQILSFFDESYLVASALHQVKGRDKAEKNVFELS